MVLISYDIASDKLRAKFSKFLKKYGHRTQLSVYEIHNSQRMLSIVLIKIEEEFAPRFSNSDSVLVIPITPADTAKIRRYGYAANDELDYAFVE